MDVSPLRERIQKRLTRRRFISPFRFARIDLSGKQAPERMDQGNQKETQKSFTVEEFSSGVWKAVDVFRNFKFIYGIIYKVSSFYFDHKKIKKKYCKWLFIK